jgi:hypothetical protein
VILNDQRRYFKWGRGDNRKSFGLVRASVKRVTQDGNDSVPIRTSYYAAEQTLLVVATAVKKSTKWALKDW